MPVATIRGIPPFARTASRKGLPRQARWPPAVFDSGKHLAGIIGQCLGACSAILDIGRRDRHLLDQRRIGIRPDIGLEAMNGVLSPFGEAQDRHVANPQKRRKDARSSSASASFTSDKSYQIESGNALNIASGGQAGSPLVAE